MINLDKIAQYLNVGHYELYKFVDRNWIPRERKWIRINDLDKIIKEYL